MANETIYISFPIVETVVLRAEQEDSEYENSVKAMSSAILNYYFPPVNGFAVFSEQSRPNDYGYKTYAARIRRHFEDGRAIDNHTVAVVEMKKQVDSGSLDTSLERLEHAVENSKSATEAGRCWALLIRGVEFMFYEYHQHRPGNDRLLPWGPPDQPERNVYHVRQDAGTIDWMLRRMAQQDTPPIRR